ncbi:sugar phosphate isomerase/epimerase family protein [Ochrobactrum sp. S1502_03]|uniref:sugar phosphate isomerase/epimerase family protein n=1 Tax=Ochrobactrum sp. S1502_03 TaxID=3108451 RepID=UPI0037C8851A
MTRGLDRFSMNTATLGFQTPIAQTVDMIARAGFAGLAPWRRELEGTDARQVGRLIRDCGLSVSGYCRSTYFPASSQRDWQANVDDNKRALNEAAELQAACFVLVVGGLPNGSRNLPDARQQVKDGICALLETATELNVPLALEPLHPMYAADRACVNTVEQSLDICRKLAPENPLLGVAVDAYHTWWDPKLPEMMALAQAEDRLLACHINDWLVPTRDMLMDRGMPGDGIIDLSAFCALAEAKQYSGFFELEILSNELWKLDAHDIITQSARTCQAI